MPFSVANKTLNTPLPVQVSPVAATIAQSKPIPSLAEPERNPIPKIIASEAVPYGSGGGGGGGYPISAPPTAHYQHSAAYGNATAPYSAQQYGAASYPPAMMAAQHPIPSYYPQMQPNRSNYYQPPAQ
jgi:hypothetical protein